jgi:DNA polymerase-3 subunit delta
LSAPSWKASDRPIPMKYSEFLKAVASKSAPPVITFFGKEGFLKERALEALLKQYLPEESRSYNFRSLSGDEIRDTSFLEDASTLPMFSEQKVILIKKAAALEKSVMKFREYLQRYLDKPSPDTLLIFDVDEWESRSKLRPILTQKSQVVEFNPLSEKELPSWIHSHLRTLHFQIDPEAVQALVERTGPVLQKIASDLEKLMLLRQSEKVIHVEDVENMVGHTPQATVWQWTEAILDQNAELAVKLLDDLLEREEEPVYCVVLLGKQYEKMIHTKEMVQQRVPNATISQKINKPAYYLQKYLNQLNRFTMQDLVKATTILAAADRALKTGQAADHVVLQLMTIQLCSLKVQAEPIFDVPLQ